MYSWAYFCNVNIEKEKNGDITASITRACKGKKGLRKSFWDYVDKHGECWVWIGPKYSSGYGWYNTGMTRSAAHKYAYCLEKGRIPEGMFVCHTCENPSCVRPEHLFLGIPENRNT